MNPILLLVLGGGALAYLASRGGASTSPGGLRTPTSITPGLLAEITKAVASQDPRKMRDLARRLRLAGFEEQAKALEEAAGIIERTPIDVDEPPPGAVPVPVRPVPGPPVGARPVPSPAPVRPSPVPDAPRVIDVEVPPPGASPETGDMARRIPAGVEPLTADYARMVYASGPRGPVKDTGLSETFKRANGVAGKSKYYGTGPALALIRQGVVPPTPWDWQQADVQRDKLFYTNNLKEAKRNDPSRGDLWDAAIRDVANT